MSQIWWKAIRWLATLGVMLWFVVLPLMPLYGWFRPWPQVQEKLREEAVTGLPLMIGAGHHSERRIDRSGEYWREVKKGHMLSFQTRSGKWRSSPIQNRKVRASKV
jgi:hypothetical protein